MPSLFSKGEKRKGKMGLDEQDNLLVALVEEATKIVIPANQGQKISIDFVHLIRIIPKNLIFV